MPIHSVAEQNSQSSTSHENTVRTLIVIVSLLIGGTGGSFARPYLPGGNDQANNTKTESNSDGLTARQEAQVKTMIAHTDLRSQTTSQEVSGLREEISDIKQSVARIEALLEKDRGR